MEALHLHLRRNGTAAGVAAAIAAHCFAGAQEFHVGRMLPKLLRSRGTAKAIPLATILKGTGTPATNKLPVVLASACVETIAEITDRRKATSVCALKSPRLFVCNNDGNQTSSKL